MRSSSRTFGCQSIPAAFGLISITCAWSACGRWDSSQS